MEGVRRRLGQKRKIGDWRLREATSGGDDDVKGFRVFCFARGLWRALMLAFVLCS